MAIRYLGPAIDIHTGGIDHVAVHHPNEIAQSENALGVRPWVSFWMHGGWLVHDGAKISKSREAERKPPHLDDLAGISVTPAGFRYYLYTAHYRSSLALSDDALRGAEAARRRLRAITRIRAARAAGPSSVAPLATGSALSNLRERFHRHLASDLDAPGALATLWEIAGLGTAPIAQRGALIAELAGVIGLDLSDTEGAEELRTSPQIASLLQAREAARQAHNFALADALRAQLATLGVGVEDTSQGQRHHPLF
jgi:cysteinyl-tRNA synthetase